MINPSITITLRNWAGDEFNFCLQIRIGIKDRDAAEGHRKKLQNKFYGLSVSAGRKSLVIVSIDILRLKCADKKLRNCHSQQHHHIKLRRLSNAAEHLQSCDLNLSQALSSPRCRKSFLPRHSTASESCKRQSLFIIIIIIVMTKSPHSSDENKSTEQDGLLIESLSFVVWRESLLLAWRRLSHIITSLG